MENGKTIFMIVNYKPSDKSLGISKKIKGVIDAFTRKGFIVYYSTYCSTGIEIYNNLNSVIYEKKYSFGKGYISGISRRFDLLHACYNYIDTSGITFDIVFFRYMGFDKTYIRLLKLCKMKDTHIIVDMHGYFWGMKSRDLKGRYMNMCTNLFYKDALQYINVLLTEGNNHTMFGRKTIEALIGIETNDFREHIYKGLKDEINMISVANETIYHGYDRVVNSLEDYYKKGKNKIKIKLHLVGVISKETQKLIKSKGLNQFIILHGKQFGMQLMDIYDQCNMAIGPLGQHRIGGKKDTGLKTKEYFGMGIPYFYTGIDSTVPKGYPYVFCVPSDETLISFDEIINFYNSYKNKPGVAKAMREFAIKNYSWDKITDSFLKNYRNK